MNQDEKARRARMQRAAFDNPITDAKGLLDPQFQQTIGHCSTILTVHQDNIPAFSDDLAWVWHVSIAWLSDGKTVPLERLGRGPRKTLLWRTARRLLDDVGHCGIAIIPDNNGATLHVYRRLSDIEIVSLPDGVIGPREVGPERERVPDSE